MKAERTNLYTLLRARWYVWKITRHVTREGAGKRVSKLVIPEDVVDVLYKLAIEAGERDWAGWLLSLPRL